MKKLFLSILVQFFMCVCFATLSNAALRNLPYELEWGDTVQKAMLILRDNLPNIEQFNIGSNQERIVLRSDVTTYGQKFTLIFGFNHNKLCDIGINSSIFNTKDNIKTAKFIANKIIDVDFDIKKFYKLTKKEVKTNFENYIYSNKYTQINVMCGLLDAGSKFPSILITFYPN